MSIVLGFYGEQATLRIRQGATFGPIKAQMFSDAARTVPVDLTGCVVRGQIRATALDPAVLLPLSCTITDPAQGKYEFSLSDEQTATLPAGESLKDKVSKAEWDLELQDSGGNVIPLYYGPVITLREVTRL